MNHNAGGGAVNLAGFLTGLEAYRGKLDAVIDATRDLLSLSSGNGAAAAPEPVAVAAPRRKALPAPKPQVAAQASDVGDARGKARRLWDAGKSVADISAAVGKSGPTIYKWRDEDAWPARDGKAKPALRGAPNGPDPVDPETYLCKYCRKFGHDEKRCPHCQEKR